MIKYRIINIVTKYDLLIVYWICFKEEKKESVLLVVLVEGSTMRFVIVQLHYVFNTVMFYMFYIL